MKSISANINYAHLKEKMEREFDCYMPTQDCPLLKHRPGFLVDCLQKTIDVFPRKGYIDALHKDFSVKVKISDATLCMMVMEDYGKLYKTSIRKFPLYTGFDMNHLPDTNYLLMLLAQVNPLNPVIQGLPKKGSQLNSEWRNAVYQNALDNMITNGKVAEALPVDIIGAEDYIETMTQAARAYYFLRFKAGDFAKKIRLIGEAAKNNALIASLVVTFDPAAVVEGGLTEVKKIRDTTLNNAMLVE